MDFEAMGREKRGWRLGEAQHASFSPLTWVILGGEAVGVVLRGIDGPHSPPPWPALLQVASNPEEKEAFHPYSPKKGAQ